MAKRHIYKKPKNDKPIEVTVRQLTELYEKHESILTSYQYKDLKEMVFVSCKKTEVEIFLDTKRINVLKIHKARTKIKTTTPIF